jgi:hypothetical protein
MKKIVFIILIIALIILLLYGFLCWQYWLSVTDYPREFGYLLYDYKIKLVNVSEFMLLNQIEEIEITDKSRNEYSIKVLKALNQEDNKFIKENILPLFVNLYYHSWDLWGVVGGNIEFYKIKRQNNIVIFYCRNISIKKNNVRLVYVKDNDSKVIKKYRLKRVENNWFYFISNT